MWPKWKAVKPIWRKLNEGCNNVMDDDMDSDNPRGVVIVISPTVVNVVISSRVVVIVVS